MRILTNSRLLLVALLFAVVLTPATGWAGTKNCPAEPKTGVTIASGGVFAGANCNLYTDGDVDSFVFSGTAGETYQLALAINDPTQTSTNICMTIYNPSAVQIFFGCTVNNYPDYEIWSVVTDQTLTATGIYTVDVTEVSNATTNYATSLERLNPVPTNAKAASLAVTYDGDITPITDSNVFTFKGATTGTYQISATVPAAITTPNLCMVLYSPTGHVIGSPACTVNDYPDYEDWTATIDITPPSNGVYMVFLYVQGNDATVTYNLEISCLAGVCPTKLPPPPACELKDALTYNASSGTLTMTFTLGTPVVATWNGWLTSENTMQSLWSQSQPITEPPVTVTQTQALAKSGKVGILSTLTTPTGGITCSSWTLLNSGTP